MRFLLAGALLSYLLSAPANQNPASKLLAGFSSHEPPSLEALLDSSDVRERAWAAHLIASHGLKEFVPALEELLPARADEGFGGPESECLYRVILDSLIQLGGPLSPERFKALYWRFPAESIILVTKSPERHHSSLLSLFDRSIPEPDWLALGNLLLQTNAAGFARTLMKQMEAIDVLAVVIDEPLLGGIAGSDLSGVIGLKIPEGFPPVAFYRLIAGPPLDTAALVASGPCPIYYQRRLFNSGLDVDFVDKGRVLRHHSHRGDMRDHYRFEYLAVLLGERVESVKFDSKPYRLIPWRDPEEYLNEITAACYDALKSYRGLVNHLLRKGLLCESEAQELTPRVRLDIKDSRKDRSTNLPKIRLPESLFEM